ncbi:uncharacterized protein BJ212DRAFT_1387302 [Suillus subaureus]|uniref:Uncharacterized protein n=1 Tax=Suillus subaureus TaxID=48587 RepID=A0A9P7J823_9AGAM|nr:uncharacterized protein BJ212DRAFT_1387302 [Suillus subaureus]KAG1807265.1 hypothetical protein BJ212DRAFT_1387302 [Suillus subaureus]
MNEALFPHDAHSSNNPIPAPSQGKLFMDEATLGELSRAQLQKVAKAHGVKANMKSAVIIRELVKLSKVDPVLREESEEPPRKKSRTTEEGLPAAGPSTRTIDLPMDTSFDPPIIQEDAPTPVLILAEHTTPTKVAGHAGDVAPDNLVGKSPSLSPLVASPNRHPASEDDCSDSGGSYLSYGSPNQQQYYKSPVSSRAGTPPPEEPQLLNRAVNIMKQITADDQRILIQAAALRQRAAGLKEQARNVRDVVRAERGRRERLEAYFTYWREIAPNWPKDWIYEEGEEDQMRTERVLKTMTPPLPSTGPIGPPTLPFDGRDAL